jgi:hypothetical protein
MRARGGIWLCATCICAASAGPAVCQAPADASTTSVSSEDSWSLARAALDRGNALFDVANYDAALAEFLVAHRNLKGHPRQYVVLQNIAACHERRFRYDSALRYYRLYLEQGGPTAEDRGEIEAAAIALDRLLARLSVQSNVAAEVWIDDRRAGHAPGTLRVPPGKYLLELRAPVHEPARREVYVGAGANLSVRFELNRLSQYRGLKPAIFWVGAGATAAAVVAGSAFGVSALLQSDAAQERRSQSPFLNTRSDERDVHTSAVGADISFASAAVFGVTSLVIYFLTDWSAQPVAGP